MPDDMNCKKASPLPHGCTEKESQTDSHKQYR